jgi:membrane fusion protein (multidrug efflux system)
MRVFLIIAALSITAQMAAAQAVTAILEPVNQVEVRAAVNGRLADVLVNEGDVVPEGTVLATIDASVQQARVELARLAAESAGGLERADIAVKQAQALRDRMARARSKGAAQKWEVVQAEQNLELALADRVLALESNQQAQGQLALETAILNEFAMTAPFDGTVLQVFADKGEIVDTQMTVIEIGNMSRLEATAFVPLGWLDWLAPGGEISMNIEGQSKSTSGRVTSIDPRIDPASRSVRVKVILDNTSSALLAGTSVSLSRP